jgi:hypothetical protein
MRTLLVKCPVHAAKVSGNPARRVPHLWLMTHKSPHLASGMQIGRLELLAATTPKFYHLSTLPTITPRIPTAQSMIVLE